LASDPDPAEGPPRSHRNFPEGSPKESVKHHHNNVFNEAAGLGRFCLGPAVFDFSEQGEVQFFWMDIEQLGFENACKITFRDVRPPSPERMSSSRP
jgi:hypothetical protein